MLRRATDLRLIEELARLAKNAMGEDGRVIQYLVECRETIRDEYENTMDVPRMHQLQGASQVLSELIKLCREAPEVIHRARQ